MTISSKAIINNMAKVMNAPAVLALTHQTRIVMIMRVKGNLRGQLDYGKLRKLRAVKGVARCYVRHGQNRTIVKVILSKKFEF